MQHNTLAPMIKITKQPKAEDLLKPPDENTAIRAQHSKLVDETS